jgi:hypothetical protein
MELEELTVVRWTGYREAAASAPVEKDVEVLTWMKLKPFDHG